MGSKRQKNAAIKHQAVAKKQDIFFSGARANRKRRKPTEIASAVRRSQRSSEAKFSNIMNVFWISNGLREFWEKAIVLKLAARACSKQYCLTPNVARGSCIAWASIKTDRKSVV